MTAMKHLTLLIIIVLGLGTSATVVAAQPGTFYVSANNGNDAWSGSSPEPQTNRTDGPLTTPQAAIEAARKLGTANPRRIVLAAGEYFLNCPVVLDARDSGLTIEALSGTKPVLYGGRRIIGWQPDGDRFWAANLPEVAARKWDFRMLAVNGRLCQRAKLPREGFFTHLNKFDVPWMSTSGGGWKRKPTPEELTTMKYRPEDLGPWLDLNSAELTVYHMWDESMVGLARIDLDSHTLTFSSPCGHPPGAFGVQKYVVHNVREGMAAPGQWYLDRTAGKVVYWPLPGENMTRADVLAPTTERIIQVIGTEAEPVRNVTIRELSLAVTNVPLKAGGFGASAYDGAVSLKYSEGCRLRNLTICNVAGQGIKAVRSRNLRIESCTIHDTGACGVLVGQTDGAVTDNHVHHVGRVSPSAIGISIQGRGDSGVEISNNEVHDTPYTGVACSGDDHRITGNLIYRAMQELHDGAGIYITFCKRVTVRGNFVRDIQDTGGYGASAYYLDEQAEDCLVEQNLSVGVSRASHNHMAHGNTIRNNVFMADGPMSITFIRSSGYRFEKNVISAKGDIELMEIDGVSTSRDNILFSPGGVAKTVKWADRTKDDESRLIPVNGWHRVAPGLSPGVEKGAVRFLKGSAGERLGIRPFDVSEAGHIKPPVAR